MGVDDELMESVGIIILQNKVGESGGNKECRQ